jgi:hypothetical protein
MVIRVIYIRVNNEKDNNFGPAVQLILTYPPSAFNLQVPKLENEPYINARCYFDNVPNDRVGNECLLIKKILTLNDSFKSFLNEYNDQLKLLYACSFGKRIAPVVTGSVSLPVLPKRTRML